MAEKDPKGIGGKIRSLFASNSEKTVIPATDIEGPLDLNSVVLNAIKNTLGATLFENPSEKGSFLFVLRATPDVFPDGTSNPPRLELYPKGLPGDELEEISLRYSSGDGKEQLTLKNLTKIELEPASVVLRSRGGLTESVLALQPNGVVSLSTVPHKQALDRHRRFRQIPTVNSHDPHPK